MGLIQPAQIHFSEIYDLSLLSYLTYTSLI